jgi:hypothetical protein
MGRIAIAAQPEMLYLGRVVNLPDRSYHPAIIEIQKGFPAFFVAALRNHKLPQIWLLASWAGPAANRIDTHGRCVYASHTGLSLRLTRNYTRAANYWLQAKYKYTLSRLADMFSDDVHCPSLVRLKT